MYSDSEIIKSHTGIDALFSREWSHITMLHEGRYYVVHRAMRMGQWFVLKSVKPGCDNRALHESLLLKEFNLGFGVRHNCIVRMLAMEEVDGLGQCIVMDYVDGETLDQVIAQNSISMEQAVGIVNDLCQALEYLHSRQMVHRDVKPHNIIVDPQHRHAVLIDLGLADSSNYAMLKMPAGTRQYIAPECAGEGITDALGDIYSLGVVVSEMSRCVSGSGANRLRLVAARCMLEDRSKRVQSALDVVALLHKKSYRWLWISLAAITACVIVALWLFNSAQDGVSTVQESPIGNVSTLPSPGDSITSEERHLAEQGEAVEAVMPPAKQVEAIEAKTHYDYDSIIKCVQAFANDFFKREQVKYIRSYVNAKRDRGEKVDSIQEVADFYGEMEVMRLNALGDEQVKKGLHDIARSTYFSTRGRLLKELPKSDARFDSVITVVMKRFYIGYSYDNEFNKDMAKWKNM